MEDFFVQELFSSSDSSSDDDVEARGPLILTPRIQGYIEFVVDRYSDQQFRENFRMSRTSFNQVLALIQDRIETDHNYIGHHTIAAKTQLLLAVWYFATPDSYRSVCNRFNIGPATGLRSVRRVANALLQISPNIIKWPMGEQINEVCEGFRAKGFPSTIGAIDGSHIQIPKPKEHGISYINRHNQSSIVLQAVCDSALKFTDCYAGEVGSSHDARVLRRSSLWEKIIEDNLFPNDTHLVGDKAYPCLPHLQVPYKDNGHLTPAQINYNFRLSSARTVIERAFGMLKARFRCLFYLDIKKIEWAPKYVIACCIMHNICLNNNDYLDVPEAGNIDNIEEEPQALHPIRHLVQLGHAKRGIGFLVFIKSIILDNPVRERQYEETRLCLAQVL